LHLARAINLYHGHLDFDGALAELERARQTLPNNPEVFFAKGAIQRRQGRWEEAMRNQERAIELDPRNVFMLQETALSHQFCRRYAEQKSLLDRVLTVVPNDVFSKAARAFVEFDSKAETRPLHDVIDSVAITQPGTLSSASTYWFMYTLAERDAAAANTALIGLGDNPRYLGVADNVVFNRAFAEGVVARLTNQNDKAQAAFTAARAEQEKLVQAQPNYAEARCVLGLLDAALGRKEEALREGRRAVELLPVEKDALDGNFMVKYLAMIAAWVGDKDLACEQLASAIQHPSDLSYGQLKLLPYWDSLRGDPRFEKLVEEAKQPVALDLVETSPPAKFDKIVAAAKAASKYALEPLPEKSIAVLPLENLSDEKENAFFAAGIHDELLSNLSKIADLKVISRTSVMQYKSGSPRNIREIGQQLGVAHVLEGIVQRAANRVKVSAQLIDARTDAHLWAQTYDRKLSDIFSVESEVAKAIADQLRAKLTGQEEQAISAKPTDNVEAYVMPICVAWLSTHVASTPATIPISEQKPLVFMSRRWSLTPSLHLPGPGFLV
jgi:TolB-like protein/Tfp pilus assembly protein PilF